jgi:E3 ubiquitin-protein ligase MARCH6
MIQDPHDPQYHPITELHQTAASAQLQKLIRSAVLYGVILAMCFGVPIYAGRLALPSILPLRWELMQPISSVPIDLLAYYIFVPVVIRVIRPKRLLRRAYVKWARLTARQLRLTSFLFGQRRASEEGHHVRRTWSTLLLLKRAPTTVSAKTEEEADVVWERDGTFMRVPAVDSVKVVRGRAMFVRVDASGRPLDEAGARTIAAQVADSENADTHFTTVYLPPNFRARICAFLYLCWVSGILAAAGLLLAPRASAFFFFCVL